MAWETPGAVTGDVGASQVLAEESANAFMVRVYRWMFAGLALTGVTAFAVASSPAVIEVIYPLLWPIVIANFILVMIFQWIAPKVSAPAAAAMFITYAFGTGLWMSLIFIVFTLGSISAAFAISAGTFGAMSIYGTVTKKSLSGWGAFLYMGLFGFIIAIIVNIFVASTMLDWVINCGLVVVFAGLTAYKTQMLRQYHASMGYSSSGALAIHGALTLYLTFVNLFLRILMLLGRRR